MPLMKAVRRRLARAFDIRPGESVLVGRVALVVELGDLVEADRPEAGFGRGI